MYCNLNFHTVYFPPIFYDLKSKLKGISSCKSQCAIAVLYDLGNHSAVIFLFSTEQRFTWREESGPYLSTATTTL